MPFTSIFPIARDCDEIEISRDLCLLGWQSFYIYLGREIEIKSEAPYPGMCYLLSK